MANGLIAAAVLLVIAMASVWFAWWRGAGSGWIDVTWTFATGISCIVSIVLSDAPMSSRVLLGALVALWSLRLGGHLLERTLRSPVDARYHELTGTWGDAAPWRLFVFLQVQAVAGLVLVFATMLAIQADVNLVAPISLLGAGLAVTALAGETIADRQLVACKRAAPELGICDQGLWALSRHPNYFFEWLFWVAIGIIALSPPVTPTRCLALSAPVMMYAILRYGSGVPHVEAHLARTCPEAFRRYAERTPIFFPRIWQR